MVIEPAPSPAPHWLALFTNSHGCTPTPRLGFLPFNVNWDLGPSAGWVPAACRLGPLFYLLPAGTALLPLCLLAGRLCKATRGHRVEPADCGPAQGQGRCRGWGWAVSPPTPCSWLRGQVQRAGHAGRTLSPWLGMGSRREPSASLPLSQGRALQLAGCLQARAQGENPEEGRSGEVSPSALSTVRQEGLSTEP